MLRPVRVILPPNPTKERVRIQTSFHIHPQTLPSYTSPPCQGKPCCKETLTPSRSTTDQTLENQNDDELNSLHGKIKALRSVRVVSTCRLYSLAMCCNSPVAFYRLLNSRICWIDHGLGCEHGSASVQHRPRLSYTNPSLSSRE